MEIKFKLIVVTYIFKFTTQEYQMYNLSLTHMDCIYSRFLVIKFTNICHSDYFPIICTDILSVERLSTAKVLLHYIKLSTVNRALIYSLGKPLRLKQI